MTLNVEHFCCCWEWFMFWPVAYSSKIQKSLFKHFLVLFFFFLLLLLGVYGILHHLFNHPSVHPSTNSTPWSLCRCAYFGSLIVVVVVKGARFSVVLRLLIIVWSWSAKMIVFFCCDLFYFNFIWNSSALFFNVVWHSIFDFSCLVVVIIRVEGFSFGLFFVIDCAYAMLFEAFVFVIHSNPLFACLL